MAVYNGEKYLPAQLESFAKQTRLPDEIVVSDDGSTDGSVELLRTWGESHPELGLRILEGRGPGNYSGNFERAFAAVTGDLMFPSDQDDVWLPEKLAVMSAVMERDPKAMVAIHDTEITDSELRPVGQLKMARQSMLGGAMQKHTDGMASAVRVPFLRLCTPLPQNFSYDMWLHHCALSLGVKRLVDQPLAYWRRHSNAASASFIQNSSGSKGWFALNAGHIRFAARNDRDGRDLLRTIEKAHQTYDWLNKNTNAIFDVGVLPSAVQHLETELLSLITVSRKRMEIRGRNRALRILPVVKLFRAGGYRKFRGLHAAVKDVFI